MPYLEHHPVDFFPRYLLQDELVNPRLALRRIFDEQVSLPDARKWLEKWLSATFYNKPVLNRKFILLLMGFQEDILRLLEAAHLLRLEAPQHRVPVLAATTAGAGLPEPALYCGTLRGHYTAWHYLPRYLSPKDFADPYRVFDKLYAWKTLPEWRDILQHFFSAAVSGQRIFESNNDDNIYLTCRHLLKLTEAAHLVHVRAAIG